MTLNRVVNKKNVLLLSNIYIRYQGLPKNHGSVSAVVIFIVYLLAYTLNLCKALCHIEGVAITTCPKKIETAKNEKCSKIDCSFYVPIEVLYYNVEGVFPVRFQCLHWKELAVRSPVVFRIY